LLDEIPKLANTAEAYRRLISAPRGAKDLAFDGLGVWRLADGSYLVASKPPGPGASQVDDADEIARHLGQLLLAPISERLRGRKRIILSADSALALVPFELLQVGGRMLIADHDVSYTQSLSMLALLKSRDEEYRRRTERKDLLVMGNAIYETASVASAARSGTTSAGRSADRSGLDIGKMAIRSARDPQGVRRMFESLKVRWSNLPGTETEVGNVAGLFARERTAVFTQRDATEAKLLELNKRQVLRDYRYLLFSAHGYLSMDEPALSSLVLGQWDKTPGTDGYITAAEWPGYDLASDLVVLSACDTGLGKVVQGEGVMGLPYALFVAGNKNTLLSLWPVADASTAEFMTAFFTRLQKGAEQSAALSDTKREFIAGGRFDQAVFWAPFLLYGY
jgi:CHAT domain-containing protein